MLARGEVVQLVHPTFGPAEGLYGAGLPIVFSESETSLVEPAPRLGQHTESVLTTLLGYDEKRVAALRDGGAL